MAKKADVFTGSGIDTIIGSGVRLKGNLSSDGDISIDGALAGNIKSGGHVTIGVNGRIGGSIHAATVQIAGQLEGNIVASDAVSLGESAHVVGDIACGQLEVGLGAIFIGTSKMKAAQASEVPALESAE